jgi:hypothetical protein
VSGVPAQKIVRVIDAADNETIRIRWWRVRLADSDPQQQLTEQLITEHTAPPNPVWTTRQQPAKDENA